MEVWTSLEIAKLMVQAAVPAVLAYIGFALNSELKRRENIEWRSRIHVEWRLRILEEMATDLNKLYCAFKYVGDWRSRSPREILDLKRQLDRKYHTYQFLWSPAFGQAYSRLIASCFVTDGGPGREAVLRANVARYKEAWHSKWQAEWDQLFVDEEQRLRREEFDGLYAELMGQFAKDLGITTDRKEEPR